MADLLQRVREPRRQRSLAAAREPPAARRLGRYTRVSPGHGRRGRLVVEAAGTEHLLEEGDSCYFDSSLPHRCLNPGDEPAGFLIATSPPSY
ncbi:cupin domain-containing protein [Nonomuraea sp. NPDC049309]|uniref:cupin domain-containing protein n=1 Tax=Nonomuraea sp. NPDC049309 TaxID=3364350 RepID=UPI00371EA02B